jgi:hypothetical protein
MEDKGNWIALQSTEFVSPEYLDLKAQVREVLVDLVRSTLVAQYPVHRDISGILAIIHQRDGKIYSFEVRIPERLRGSSPKIRNRWMEDTFRTRFNRAAITQGKMSLSNRVSRFSARNILLELNRSTSGMTEMWQNKKGSYMELIDHCPWTANGRSGQGLVLDQKVTRK